MKRRAFITLLGGAAALPLAARAQQPERMRRIGVLMNFAAEDAEGQARLAAFLQGLQQAGWAVGHNVRIDTRWGAGDPDRYRQYVAELLALTAHFPAANPLFPAAARLQGAPDSVLGTISGKPAAFTNVPAMPETAVEPHPL